MFKYCGKRSFTSSNTLCLGLINNALYCIRSLSGMVVPSSREVMTYGVETMVIGSNPLWVPVRPSVKRATPQSKNALWIRTTVNTLIGTVFRVVW